MKKTFLNIAIVILMSSVLLTLCGQHRALQKHLPQPDKHFPFIEQPGSDCENNGLEERRA